MKNKIQIPGKGAWFVLFCFYSATSGAQETQGWFRRESGIIHAVVYDNVHSLAQYKGTGVQFQFGLDKETPKKFNQLNLGLQFTPLTANVENAKEVTSALQGNFSLSYKHLQKIRATRNSKFKLAIGASAFIDANARYYRSLINNPFGWDLNIGLNIIGLVTHDFNFRKHSYTIAYQLGLPTVVYNHSPNYLGNTPVSSDFNRGDISDWTSLGRVVVFVNDKYFYLHQQFGLDRNLRRGNKLRVTYRWDYSNNGYATHRYQNLTTSISIGLLTSYSKTN